jgi:cytosine deaminase
MIDWILRRARVADNRPLVDIAIADGRILALGQTVPQPAASEWDLEGRAVLPGLIDAHAHLDKTYTTIENHSGTLLEAIEVWNRIKQQRNRADVRTTADRAIQSAVANGITVMRSHVDTEVSGDLVALEALLDLREQTRHMIDVQLVALGMPGGTRENRETIEEAMRLGVDVVGGAPALSADPHGDIEAAFDLAERHAKALDLHIDETEDPNTLTLEYLADQTRLRGMQGNVTAGHCCSLAFIDDTTAARVMDKVAEAQLNIVTLPSCNLVLMGREGHPAPRGTTRVKELLARGVNVCAASDNVHDPFNPFGSYDLLQIANLNGHTAHMSGEAELYACLQMVTANAARALVLQGDYGLAAGRRADLVIVDATRVLDAVVSPPPRLGTFKAGRLVVKTDVRRTWNDASI